MHAYFARAIEDMKNPDETLESAYRVAEVLIYAEFYEIAGKLAQF